MRSSRPRIWRGGSKPARRTVTHEPPPSRAVTVEVMGVSAGLQRIDLVSDEQATQPTSDETVSEPEPDRWETIEEALAAAKAFRRPNPWDRLTR